MSSIWAYFFGSRDQIPSTTNNLGYESTGLAKDEVEPLIETSVQKGNAVIMDDLTISELNEQTKVHLSENELTDIKKGQYYRGLKIGILITGLTFSFIIVLAIILFAILHK